MPAALPWPGVPGTTFPNADATEGTKGVRGRFIVLGVRGRPCIMLVIIMLAFMVLARPGRDAIMAAGPV